MIREQRYIVLKIKDCDAALTDHEKRTLARICSDVTAHRRCHGRPEMSAVVVESDWPEYEPTWAAIAARMDSPRSAHPNRHRENTDWIPVVDRMPPNNVSVIVCCVDADDGEGAWIGSGFHVPEGWQSQDSIELDKPMAFTVTHWMPLPLPPNPEPCRANGDGCGALLGDQKDTP